MGIGLSEWTIYFSHVIVKGSRSVSDEEEHAQHQSAPTRNISGRCETL